MSEDKVYNVQMTFTIKIPDWVVADTFENALHAMGDKVYDKLREVFGNIRITSDEHPHVVNGIYWKHTNDKGYQIKDCFEEPLYKSHNRDSYIGYCVLDRYGIKKPNTLEEKIALDDLINKYLKEGLTIDEIVEKLKISYKHTLSIL